MSHTVKLEVKISNMDALASAAVACGGAVLGEGFHQLFQGKEQGFAVSLPGWMYPVVATSNGVKFDNYNGRWGKQETLDKLVARYPLEAAKIAADAQGWLSEFNADGLLIYHPDGGTITVTSDGEVNAACFEGRNCSEATSPIENALGKPINREIKPEYWHERQMIKASE